MWREGISASSQPSQPSQNPSHARLVVAAPCPRSSAGAPASGRDCRHGDPLRSRRARSSRQRRRDQPDADGPARDRPAALILEHPDRRMVHSTVPPDIYFSYLTGALWAIAIALYGLRVATRGSVHSDRVAKFGDSVLIGRGTMDMAYWAIEPLVRGLARAGITANALTWAALVLGLGAGAAAAAGWYGLTVLLGTLSTVGDILDG